ncbi:hypothetical protein [Paenibacillus silvae]|uniref:Uncharacterized protein n=1 Tax=Paenibacillus silvae TaxID=1325358 RepID=A0A2W6N7X8_9BACL|nr:hypothetical protein [Paenibacillus silvae]PZT52012.1 hypothetical protein DN757_29750 [Paenibacillus silvae]
MHLLTESYAITGAWVVNTYKSIQNFNLNEAVFDPYESVIISAKVSMLLSPMRKLGVVNATQFDIYRKMAGLKPRECIDVLKILEGLEAVSITWSESTLADVPLDTITVRRTDKVDILSVTGELFEKLNPSVQAKLTIHMLQETLKIPIPKDLLITLLIHKGYPEQLIKTTLKHMLVLNILSETKDTVQGHALVYNPNAFQANASDVFVTINDLNPTEKQEALDILEYVRSNPGTPLHGNFNQNTVRLLINCGLIDSSRIVTSRGKTKQDFVTAPYIWGALGANELSSDVLDDAKLFLNCLRFGQLFSQSNRGRINDPSVLINALLEKGTVGPATAIGEDYPMPLARGIVSVVESRLQPGRYFMELKKEDVVQTVYEVLDTKGVLPTPINDTEVATKLKQQGNFISSEQVRIASPLPAQLEQERDSLVFCLRTHRKGR